MTHKIINSHEVTSYYWGKAAGTGDLSVQDKGICYSQESSDAYGFRMKISILVPGKNDFLLFKMNGRVVRILPTIYQTPFQSSDKEYYGYAQQVKMLGAGKEYHPFDKDEG